MVGGFPGDGPGLTVEDTAMEDRQVTLTPGAQKNLAMARAKLIQIGVVFGEGSPEHVLALTTFSHMVETIFSWGGTIYGEDELSLIIGSTITIGCIWRADRKVRDGFPEENIGIAGHWSMHS